MRSAEWVGACTGPTKLTRRVSEAHGTGKRQTAYLLVPRLCLGTHRNKGSAFIHSKTDKRQSRSSTALRGGAPQRVKFSKVLTTSATKLPRLRVGLVGANGTLALRSVGSDGGKWDAWSGRTKKDGKAPLASEPILTVNLARCSPAQAGTRNLRQLPSESKEITPRSKNCPFHFVSHRAVT